MAFIQGYQTGYEESCKRQAENSAKSDPLQTGFGSLETRIQHASQDLGVARHELDAMLGRNRSLTINDALFLTMAGRDAVISTRHNASERKTGMMQERLLKSKVQEGEAHVRSLLMQKDVMRLGGEQRASIRLGPSVADVEEANKGTLESWRPSAEALRCTVPLSESYDSTALAKTMGHRTGTFDKLLEHRPLSMSSLFSSSMMASSSSPSIDKWATFTRGYDY